jgi:hypothetical protein
MGEKETKLVEFALLMYDSDSVMTICNKQN